MADDERRPATFLDRFEQMAKIFATLLVPIVLAIGGWYIQATVEHDKTNAATVQTNAQLSLERQRISLEYVKLAKDILATPKDVPPELTRWSWQLLNDVSPTKFDPADLKKLIERQDRIPLPAASATAEPIDQNGFIVYVDRARTERRAGMTFSRTVGTYYVTFQGDKIPGIEGVTVERGGPGSNSADGVLNHRRLAAGIYPLFAHASATKQYATLGYSPEGGASVRPWPAIGIENTGTRSGIIIHPASGYLMAIGTINLSGALNGPNDNIDFKDSWTRMDALIGAMKTKLGTTFPSTNNVRVPGAWVVISGEPSEPPEQ